MHFNKNRINVRRDNKQWINNDRKKTALCIIQPISLIILKINWQSNFFIFLKIIINIQIHWGRDGGPASRGVQRRDADINCWTWWKTDGQWMLSWPSKPCYIFFPTQFLLFWWQNEPSYSELGVCKVMYYVWKIRQIHK